MALGCGFLYWISISLMIKKKKIRLFIVTRLRTYMLASNTVFIMEPGVFMSKRFLFINKFSADWYINAGTALPIGPKRTLPFWSVFVRAGMLFRLN